MSCRVLKRSVCYTLTANANTYDGDSNSTMHGTSMAHAHRKHLLRGFVYLSPSLSRRRCVTCVRRPLQQFRTRIASVCVHKPVMCVLAYLALVLGGVLWRDHVQHANLIYCFRRIVLQLMQMEYILRRALRFEHICMQYLSLCYCILTPQQSPVGTP